MKKVAAVLAVVVMVVCFASLSFAADATKGTIKSIDAKAGTVVLKADGGKEETLMVDKSVDLGAVKKGDQVEVSIEKGSVMSLKVTKKKPVMGC